MPTVKQTPFPADIFTGPPAHALGAAAVLERLQSGPDGLTMEQAAERLDRYGPNALPHFSRRGLLARLFSQFNNVVIYVLLAAAAITALLGHWSDCSVIVGVVLINAAIGFIQEGKAEQALDSVRLLLTRHAVVLRGGQRRTVSADALVPGDIIFLASGDKVPADSRLLELRHLFVDESLLTGESLPVEKSVEVVSADAMTAERRCMVYSGTLVTRGQATAVVVGTGAATEIGRISSMLANIDVLTTPLLRKLSEFGRWLTVAILASGAAVFAFGVLVRGYAPDDMFLAVVGLAVAAIPEGLPAIITITMAVGVQRMARRRAIIRRLPTVETLGSVTVICSDKTGTLTRNEMRVRRIITPGGGSFEVAESDPGKGGTILRPGGSAPDDSPGVMELCRAGILCNDAIFHGDAAHREFGGDPTEIALLVLGIEAGIDPGELLRRSPRLDVIPFESGHRFMATLHEAGVARPRIYVKGAPELLLERCCSGYGTDGWNKHAWYEHARELAAGGQRTIALACRDAFVGARSLGPDDISGLSLLGLVGIVDPPREEAKAALALCHSAGIKVKMVTGDHLETAAAIASQLGLPVDPAPVSGADLERMNPGELSRIAGAASVFARTSPEQKLLLVEAMQSGGEVVAMTGDGVNDAPALKRADVGVAMGLKGTEVAREAAGMVLVDDNFASIVSAVEEGRTVFDNITKAILYILPTSIGEALTIITAILLGLVLPVTAVQILWVNMVTTVTLALALAFEPPEGDVMQRPPRPPSAPILGRFMVWRIVLVSLLMLAAVFGLFIYVLQTGADLETARTVAVNTLVVCEAAYLLNIRFFTQSSLDTRVLWGNRWIYVAIFLVMLLQMMFTYVPGLQGVFGTRNLGPGAWALVLVSGLALFLVIEIEKRFVVLARRGAQRRSA